jgi:hypothetical protein
MSIPTWQEVAEDEFWAQVPQDLHEGAVRDYLGSYGDAIEFRVKELCKVAADLRASRHFGPSIVISVTSIEVMVQYFCVRPIVGGALLSELLADEVSQHILGSRGYDQRKLLAAILKPWGVDISSILLPSGKPLWEVFQNVVMKKRNEFVHRGDEVLEGEAALALECASTFREHIVLKLAKRLGFSLNETGCWARVVHEPTPGFVGGEMHYGKSDPFK